MVTRLTTEVIPSPESDFTSFGEVVADAGAENAELADGADVGVLVSLECRLVVSASELGFSFRELVSEERQNKRLCLALASEGSVVSLYDSRQHPAQQQWSGNGHMPNIPHSWHRDPLP